MQTDATLEMFKYTLPALVLSGAAFLLMKQWLQQQRAIHATELRIRQMKDREPVRLQACERLLLFLERTDPQSLVVRVHRPGMSSQLLQSELIRTVREEYEHNLTLQLYVSGPVWQKVQEAKEAVIHITQLAAQRMGPTSTGLDLSNVIFEIIGKSGVSPTAEAIRALREEARQMM